MNLARIRCWLKGHIWRHSATQTEIHRTAKERCRRRQAVRSPPHHPGYYGYSNNRGPIPAPQAPAKKDTTA